MAELMPDSPPAGATCPTHPDRKALYTCGHCGAFGCGTCIGELRGRVVCRTCVLERRVSAYGIPWERRAEIGWIAAWGRTFGMLAARPSELFRGVDPNGPLGEAVGFALLSSAPMGLVLFLIYALIGGVGAASGVGMGAGEAAVMVGFALFYLVLLPPLSVAGCFMMAAVHHVVLLLLGGGTAGYIATARVVLYAAGLNALAGIPCVGYVVGIWTAVLQGVGYHLVHDDPPGKAAVAVLSPLVLVCGLGLLAAIAIPSLIALGG